MQLRFLIVIACLFLTASVVAQAVDCPVLIEEALDLVGDICTNMRRNEICYGNNHITTTSWDDTPLDNFEATGDVTSLLEMASLNTSGINLDDNSWGIAVLAIQANLPDTLPGQNVFFLAFGDNHIENEVDPNQESVELTTFNATANGGVNLRSGPTTNAGLVGSVAQGAAITVNGRNEAGDWLRLDHNGQEAWVFASLVTLDGEPADLAVVEPDEILYLAPMQAFRFVSKSDEPACAEAPPNGLIIQTPQNATVNFMMNGIEVKIGSTAFFSAEDSNQLSVSTFEGNVSVTSGGETQTIPPGFTLTVTEGEAPPEPTPYEETQLEAAPTNLLPEVVEIPESGAGAPSTSGGSSGSGGTSGSGESTFLTFSNCEGSVVPPGQSITYRIGFQSVDVNEAVTNASGVSVTFDGQPMSLLRIDAPVTATVEGTTVYQVYTFWFFANPTAGAHQIVTSAGGESFPCNITVQ